MNSEIMFLIMLLFQNFREKESLRSKIKTTLYFEICIGLPSKSSGIWQKSLSHTPVFIKTFNFEVYLAKVSRQRASFKWLQSRECVKVSHQQCALRFTLKMNFQVKFLPKIDCLTTWRSENVNLKQINTSEWYIYCY